MNSLATKIAEVLETHYELADNIGYSVAEVATVIEQAMQEQGKEMEDATDRAYGMVKSQPRYAESVATEPTDIDPVVEYFQRACDITGVAAAQVLYSQPMDAAAFVRYCLASELTTGNVYSFIPAGKAPALGAILDAATGMVGMLPPEERTQLTHSKLAGIAQWARETISEVAK